MIEFHGYLSAPWWKQLSVSHGSGERSPEHLAENRQLLRIVERKMEKLDPELRVILVLRDIQGMAYEEMSRVLDVPEGTIKSRLHRARNELKKQLAPYLG